MPSSLDPAPKVHSGDLREVFRNPVAFACGALGCGLAIAMALFLAHRLGGGCEARFEQGWAATGREVYNAAFRDAVLVECDTLDDAPCRSRVAQRWAADERDVHTLTFSLAITEACPFETEDAFEIDFEPGALVRLGVEDVPNEIVIPRTQTEPETSPALAVTDEQDAEPSLEQPQRRRPERPTPETSPDEPSDAPISKLPVAPTPFDDPATTTVRKGDPFGDPGGWAEMAKDGDPWATAVTKALNGMAVGAFGAKMEGSAKFQVTLCKDGSVKRVQKKGGSLDAMGQARVANAVRSLKLPKPPPAVAARMKGTCAKIKYTFVWSSGAVE